MDILSRQSDIIEEKENRSHSILKKNKDNLLSPNNNIIVEIFTIEAEIR